MSVRSSVIVIAVALLVIPLAATAQDAAAPATPQQPATAATQQEPATPAKPQEAAVAAAPAQPPDNKPNSEWVVPRYTTIPVELRNTISTRTASPGQAIYCDTIYPITVGNRIIIPAGSWVKGEVTQVVRPGRVKGKGQIGLRFLSITLPNGTTRSLRATLSGFGGNGRQGFSKKESKIEGEGSKGEDAGRVADTTITGAEIGTIAGAAEHSVGKGLGIGSAAGAAGGLIWVLASRGKEIVLPSGTSLELELAAPLDLAANEAEPTEKNSASPIIPPRDPGPGL